MNKGDTAVIYNEILLNLNKEQNNAATWILLEIVMGFPGSSVVKNLLANERDADSVSGSGKITRRRKFLPGKFSWTEELSGL